jgi:hypothetical protein
MKLLDIFPIPIAFSPVFYAANWHFPSGLWIEWIPVIELESIAVDFELIMSRGAKRARSIANADATILTNRRQVIQTGTTHLKAQMAGDY